MVNPNRFYTYAYLREDRTPYYIGKGQGNRVYKKHQKGISVPQDKSRIIYLKQNLTEAEAFRHEIYMITVLGRKDLGTGILLNKTNGGEGPSGAIFTEKWKENIKKSKLGKSTSLKGKTYKEIYGENFLNQIEKIKKSNTGKIHTEETKQKISDSKKGTVAWNKGISIPSKYVYTIKSPSGEIIKTRSIKDFCKKNNLNPCCIFRLMNGKQKQHKGWTFLTKLDTTDLSVAFL